MHKAAESFPCYGHGKRPCPALSMLTVKRRTVYSFVRMG